MYWWICNNIDIHINSYLLTMVLFTKSCSPGSLPIFTVIHPRKGKHARLTPLELWASLFMTFLKRVPLKKGSLADYTTRPFCGICLFALLCSRLPAHIKWAFWHKRHAKYSAFLGRISSIDRMIVQKIEILCGKFRTFSGVQVIQNQG